MKLVMMGTGTFAGPTFEALLAARDGHQVVGLVTQPDRAVGAERGSTRQTGKAMKTIAQEQGVPVYQPESINTPEGIDQLQKWQPDLLVVAAYGQILSRDVLAVPKHGGINVHASLLPKYRGAAPVAWAIYHGETKTGVTIIQMTPQLDAGGMIVQEAMDIGREETAGELEARLAVLGAKLARQVVDQIAARTAKPIPQDQSQASKAPKLKKEHGLIDWTRTAEQVCNQIRAMQPWPTSYTFFHRPMHESVRLIVNRARVCLDMDFEEGLRPGQIVTRVNHPARLIIGSGSGEGVDILELQPAGKRRMSAAEFLRGHPLQPGDHFGPETP
jgi:methionyl-tRNA formyltransferase